MKKFSTLYHATDYSNLVSIVDDGIKTSEFDGTVYCCEKAEDCLKFVFFRGVRDVLVCEFKVPEEEVFETFDHSFAFFKCRCFGVGRGIRPNEIKRYFKYDLGG